MSGVTTLVADEEALLARNPAVAEIHADAMRVGRESILALIDAHDALRVSDGQRFNREVDELQRRSLVDYARRIHGLLTESEVAPWQATVDRLPAAARNDLLREVGVPGAVLLLDAMEPVPDPEPVPMKGSFGEALAAIADRCGCGYATSRVAPRELCYVCATCISGAWRQEERRLLDRVPDLASALDLIFDTLLDEVSDQWNARHENTWYIVAGIRRKAARKIARANKASREQLEQFDMSRWQEFAALALRVPWPLVRSETKRWKRCGLGQARLSAIALEGNLEVKARMEERARTR